jgi:HD superfamily phosphodiesterase
MYDRDPKGPEALYLHDADALDWLGAIGAARIFALGDPDNHNALKMLQENLAAVPPRILSNAGQALRGARVRELQEFLKQLQSETSGFRAL